MIPFDFQLQIDRVLLRPLVESDYEDFRKLAQDNDAWQYFTLNLADDEQLRQWMTAALHEKELNTRRPFTIIERKTGRIAGSMSFGNIAVNDKRLEIGWSWLGSEFRGTEVNRQAKYALMHYAFETLGFERVEFKTDVRNARARRGLEKIGGKQEGILRSHMLLWNGHRRDSVYYSVLKNEWPEVKAQHFPDLAAHEIS